MADPTWILGLDCAEIAPLFTRWSEVEFLREYPRDQAYACVLEVSLGCLRTTLEFLTSSGRDGPYFCCVEVTDWTDWEEGEVAVPLPSLLVVPRADPGMMFELAPRISSREALLTESIVLGSRIGRGARVFERARTTDEAERVVEVVLPDADGVQVTTMGRF